MYNIRSTTPMTSVDGHVDVDFADRTGWTENHGRDDPADHDRRR